VLINNAGLMLLAPFGPDQREDYRRMIEVNLLGTITATEVFLNQLKAGGAADIVNISSVAGRIARPTNGVDAATKFGLNGWSDSLRQELLPEVRVTVVDPGAVATELTDHITDEATRQGVEQLYATTAITAGDIAEVIAFALGRPRHVALNEILVRPAGQA
jgi:NADP-dependent 3-hydroxy acid dehydrogenase YdfG